MAVSYFSRVKFIPAMDSHEFTEDQVRWLQRASSLLQRDIYYPEVQKIRDEENNVVETRTRNYILSGLEWHNNGNEVSGSMLKEGSITSVIHDRETAEVVEREPNDTEYKVNFYYDIRNQIVTFKTTNHFKDKQFNDALAFIIHKSIERESGQDCSFFNVQLEAITSKIDVVNLHNYIKEVAPLKRINIKLSTTDPRFHLTEETIGSGILKKNIKAEAEEGGLITDSPYIINLCNKAIKFAERLDEAENSMIGNVVVDLECMSGNKYSSTARGKYTREINDIDLEDFRNKCRDYIDNIISNKERFL